MGIKRPRIDLEKLGIIQESAADRLVRREDLSQRGSANAQSKLDRIAEHNAREDEHFRRIHHKITSGGLWLDARDLLGGNTAPMLREDFVPKARGQMMTEDYPSQRGNMLTEDFTYAEMTPPPRANHHPEIRAPLQQPAKQPAKQPAQRRSLHEQITAPQQSQAWGTKKFLGDTRAGDTIPVWKVTNAKTGSALGKLFRIESVAHKLATLLNESGDPNDPRAVSVIAAYDKRDSLLKEARQLERTAEGKPMKTERLRAVRAEINQLDYKLGI